MTFLTHVPALLALMAPSSSNSAYQQVFMFGMIFVIFYFFMILPQQKQRKEHERRINEVKRGDEVVTTGGLVGEVMHIKESTKDGAPTKSPTDRITIKSADARIIIERASIARVLTVGAGDKTT
ncbi:MAG: preprotein translocase subunit YajC [Gemmatimonadaceae bacterium]